MQTLPEAPQPSSGSIAGGSITGTVVDRTGAVVVGARVKLMLPGRPEPVQVLSGDHGQFSFSDVVPGTFEISITASGFAPLTFTGTLHSGEFYIVPPSSLAPATLRSEVIVTASRVEVAELQVKAQEKQRVLGVIPNFYISYVPNSVPLNPRQKFQLAWRSMIDPFTFALTAAAAGVQQAQKDYSGYGQGAPGYAKRFAASYTDNVTGTFIGGAILPSLLKQDPRYFYKGTGSTGSRIWYALTRAVICKGDNQRWQPDYSAILGSIASGGISNLYYPPEERGAGLVFENTAIGIGENAVANVFQEFVVKRFTTNVPTRNSSHP